MHILGRFFRSMTHLLKWFFAHVYFGRHILRVPENSIVLFPLHMSTLHCGLTGLITFKGKAPADADIDLDGLTERLKTIESNGFRFCKDASVSFMESYLGGKGVTSDLFQLVRKYKGDDHFVTIYNNDNTFDGLCRFADRLDMLIDAEEKYFIEDIGRLAGEDVDTIVRRLEELKDTKWCLTTEIASNITKIKELMRDDVRKSVPNALDQQRIKIFKKVNTVLNSIDRLEVRGRDSAGISVMFLIAPEQFTAFKSALQTCDETGALSEQFAARQEDNVLLNNTISMHCTKDHEGGDCVSVGFVYKIAAEIGRLGDNIAFIRDQIKADTLFQLLTLFPLLSDTIEAHTRWASVGAISEANCHPVDNITDETRGDVALIHCCLNGDIDNYLALKKALEDEGITISDQITTDTKIIPLQIAKHLKTGVPVAEAFRLAVNDFNGSHAIAMHTDLAPGKLFLAQKGSGQAVFVGIADDCYIPTSEVYGFVELASRYLKMNGEKVVPGKNGDTSGQIFILDQLSEGGLSGISAMYYDGTPVSLTEEDINETEITSRDIDRQTYTHYFLKEISESPLSVERTLQNRWKVSPDDPQQYVITLGEKSLPASIKTALTENRIARIFFVGQGTAGVAAMACADILNYYMHSPQITVGALKASELSGFKLDYYDQERMDDTLVVAISQSGTTTDTNRTIDMVRERGAHTLAIVNRRDSDITFKVDGVIYTSSGRDIEMSVASTKAFYSQIVAGAVLSLAIAAIKGSRDEAFVTHEIRELLELPEHMRKVLDMAKDIEASAKRLAVTKTYWAAVGSGANKASADEIRIKLSELCYKTISSDFVEDKKHIDLSSEPLIIVCAAGTRESVLGDIIKDTAIFHAHKAAPVVITDEGEERFDEYAESVFRVPKVSEHLAPILNTLVGHIWGYYAALSINDVSQFLYHHRAEIQKSVDDYAHQGLNIYEVILENSFREKIARFYLEFRAKRSENKLPSILGFTTVSDLLLLLKYLTGRLPVSDFEIDFGVKGTALNMLNTLWECLGNAINVMARPIDAIKHQAKTVTVGTSRLSAKLEGIVFDTLESLDISLSQITNSNILVIRNLQSIISEIKGAILYKISDLNILGEPTDDTKIEVLKKEGVLAPIPSRVEINTRLTGTKKIIVRQGNVYIGKGRKDDRSIVVIPVMSASSATPNIIENLLLLNIGFKENILISDKKKALGGKFEHIRNIVQENSLAWNDKYLELIETKELFGNSAEKIGEFIVYQVKVKELEF